MRKCLWATIKRSLCSPLANVIDVTRKTRCDWNWRGESFEVCKWIVATKLGFIRVTNELQYLNSLSVKTLNKIREHDKFEMASLILRCVTRYEWDWKTLTNFVAAMFITCRDVLERLKVLKQITQFDPVDLLTAVLTFRSKDFNRFGAGPHLSSSFTVTSFPRLLHSPKWLSGIWITAENEKFAAHAT